MFYRLLLVTFRLLWAALSTFLRISFDRFRQGINDSEGGDFELGIISSAAFKIIFTESLYSSTVVKLKLNFN